ncbi:MAG: flavin reductase [Bacillota bacterium]
MIEGFAEIKPEEITNNPFKLIGADYMLITAGTLKSYNTMTASWGGFGVLWNKNIAICFVRPQRYTYQFLENSDCFTLSFFDERYGKVLDYCGTKSGRDVNKALECGLTPIESSQKSVFFRQARLIIECRKLYFQDLDESSFLDKSMLKFYPKKDYHRMYVGEIVKCLIENP